jgi:septal ring factor EnvC (AmiA/AmiB activator)
MQSMDNPEKAVQAIEAITGQEVSWPTIIACIAVVLASLLWIYKQIWPIIKGKIDKSMEKTMAEKAQNERLEELGKKQEEQEKQFSQMADMMKDIAASVGRVSEQLDGISGENKLTLSVLLDMIECMQNKTSPEECAKLAQSNINLFYREGKLPPAMPN